MKVLVLGGTGLISQEIVRQLDAYGVAVTVVNRGQTAASLPAAIRHVRSDRGQIAALRPFVADANIDCIIDMIGYTESDASGVIDLASGVVPHVIYCSTVDVFVKPQDRYPVTETALRGARASFPYAAGKVASESLLESAATAGAFELTILRPAQTYGGPNHGPVHPLGHRDYHLWRLVRRMPILLHGDGSSLWSACHARDVAAAFVSAARRPATRGRSYNLASPEILTWERYWSIIGEILCGEAPSIVTLPSDLLALQFGDDGVWLQENFRFNNVFDCSAATADLGFALSADLRGGMAQTLDTYGAKWISSGEGDVGGSFDRSYEAALAVRDAMVRVQLT